jgi:hypothetical protein
MTRIRASIALLLCSAVVLSVPAEAAFASSPASTPQASAAKKKKKKRHHHHSQQQGQGQG